MKKFNMERIFKRSQKNKESYFGVELYAWPLMFFPTHDDTIEINILYESDDKRQKLAEEMLAECNTDMHLSCACGIWPCSHFTEIV